MKKQASRIPKAVEQSSVANVLQMPHSSLKTGNSRRLRGACGILAALMSISIPVTLAQQASPQHPDVVTIHGTVLNSAGKLVGDAVVRLEQKDVPGAAETKTNAAGIFEFSAFRTGSYILSAEKSGLRSRATAVIASSPGDQKQVDLVLDDSGVIHTGSFGPGHGIRRQADFYRRGSRGLDCGGRAWIGYPLANQRSSGA